MKGPTKTQLEQLEHLLLAGYSKSEIAKALETTRPTIDRWIERCDPRVIAEAKEARGGSWHKVAHKKGLPEMPELTPRDLEAAHYVFPVQIDPLVELQKLNTRTWEVYRRAENDRDKINALGEIRQQVQATLHVVKQIYDMEVAKKFMALVLEEVNQADPATGARIKQRLQALLADRAIGAKLGRV